MNQRQIFKNENIPMTQIKPENNWNLLNENFQSFGTDLITFINNDLNPIKNIDNKNEITSIKLETIKENNRFYICKNKYEITKNYDYEYNLEKYKSLLEENKNNETERLRTKLLKQIKYIMINIYLPRSTTRKIELIHISILKKLKIIMGIKIIIFKMVLILLILMSLINLVLQAIN